MLEPGRIQLVPPSQVSFCCMCGARPGDTPGVQFVSFDADGVGQHDVAGTVETAENQPGRSSTGFATAAGRRPPRSISRSSARTASSLPPSSSGYGDRTPLLEELGEQREQNANLRERLEQEAKGRTEAEAAVENLAIRERILTERLAQTAGTAKRQPAGKR
jgi:hypothetical protein